MKSLLSLNDAERVSQRGELGWILRLVEHIVRGNLPQDDGRGVRDNGVHVGLCRWTTGIRELALEIRRQEPPLLASFVHGRRRYSFHATPVQLQRRPRRA